MTHDRLVFDIETNGFYDQSTVAHSICLKDPDAANAQIGSFTDNSYSRKDGDIKDAMELLKGASEIIGHNIVKFDVPVLRKLFGFQLRPDQSLQDTFILSRLLYPDINAIDAMLMRKKRLPGKAFGKHSLNAWGYRLGVFKGEYMDLPLHSYNALRAHGLFPELTIEGAKFILSAGDFEFKGGNEEFVLGAALRHFGLETEPFAEWCPEMQEYCDQDVEVSTALWHKLRDKKLARKAMLLEYRATEVCEHIERSGFKFNVEDAEKLHGEMAVRRSSLEVSLIESFGSWWAPKKGLDDTGLGKVQIPAKTMSKKVALPDDCPVPREITVRRFSEKTGKELKPYVGPPKETVTEGCPFTPIKYVTFSPGSRDDIANRLKAQYNWIPTSFTKSGKPEVDDKTLSALEHIPECADLATYFMLSKRIGQLGESSSGKAWLDCVNDGFIRGSYNVNGTVTGRASHNYPNIGQVPAADDKVPYGKECRELFGTVAGWVLLGSDLSGLELRCLGHFMAKYDGGAYLKQILEGDIHWANVIALGLVPEGTEKDEHDPWHNTARNKIAKTFIYAFLYGAGDEKIGNIFTAHRPLTDEEIEECCASKVASTVRWMLEKQNRTATDVLIATIVTGKRLKSRFLKSLPALKKLTHDGAGVRKFRKKAKSLMAKKAELFNNLVSAKGMKKGQARANADQWYADQVKKMPEWRKLSALDKSLIVREERDGRLWLSGLDGRELHVRSMHSALNTMLQSSGAVLCKMWMVMVFDELVRRGYKPGLGTADGRWVTVDGEEPDFVICAWVHDELQIGCRKEIADEVGEVCKAQALKAGEFFEFRSPVEADYAIGNSWADTH